MPVEYQNTIIEKIPCTKMRNCASSWENWKNRSLLLHGTTRLGKTRAAWEVSRRYWKKFHKKQLFISMRNFEKMIEEGFKKYDHSARLDNLVNAPFLFIDDLGKERTTQRVACDLFAIIDERTIHHRPTIITTNFNSSTLVGRFEDQELGAALIGRFRDYFDIIGATNENNS
jgi:DNA replication protein DnaC